MFLIFLIFITFQIAVLHLVLACIGMIVLHIDGLQDTLYTVIYQLFYHIHLMQMFIPLQVAEGFQTILFLKTMQIALSNDTKINE